MKPKASSSTLSYCKTPPKTIHHRWVVGALLALLCSAPLGAGAQTMRQNGPRSARRSVQSTVAQRLARVRQVSAQAVGAEDPAYDGAPEAKLFLTDDELDFPQRGSALPDDDSDLIADSFTFPDGVQNEGYGYGYGSCCDDPAPQCYSPGDYWAGPGHAGCIIPFPYLWQNRLWFRGEYLLWWGKGSNTPPLLTTSPQGTDQDDAGVLPDATILFGDTGLNADTRSGGRMTLGYWLDPCQRFGFQTSYLSLGTTSESYDASSDGDPILARPFFNTQPRDATGALLPGMADSSLIAFDGVVDGSVAIDATSKFQQFDFLLRRNISGQCGHRLDFFLGYQANWLDDDLRTDVSLESTDPDNTVFPEGTTIDLYDLFETKNAFHGAAMGLTFQECVGRWSLELLMKVALGSTHSEVWIDGSTTTDTPQDDPNTDDGGLLALPSNMGPYEQNSFSMVPELGVTLGYDLTCRLRATFGYTFIYWSHVARPGDQIDLDVNPSQLSGDPLEGLPRPEFSWVNTDYWAQGLNFGLDYRF